MLKSVKSAIPLFSMSCLKILEKINNVTEKGMRKFFWNGNQEKDKIPLLAWEKICKQKKSGGVELRWNLVNEAMAAKLVWNMYVNPHQK